MFFYGLQLLWHFMKITVNLDKSSPPSPQKNFLYDNNLLANLWKYITSRKFKMETSEIIYSFTHYTNAVCKNIFQIKLSHCFILVISKFGPLKLILNLRSGFRSDAFVCSSFWINLVTAIYLTKWNSGIRFHLPYKSILSNFTCNRISLKFNTESYQLRTFKLFV